MPDSTETSGRHSMEPRGSLENASSDVKSRPQDKTSVARPTHQRLVFPDPVALRYLEEDPATKVLERRRRLEGYEVYLVEQWACSRVHPTFLIATYTGDLTQSIVVGVLSIPADENAWSSRLKTYFRGFSDYHARRKETPLGTLMITNLSGFPSSLTVIPVPDGDIRKHRDDFFVNENLKRMGCSGRAGFTLQPPAMSTQAKYWHVYRTSDKVPLYTSVVELVKLCQLALAIFDRLLPAYADGLLCDVTEKALNEWWSDIGTDLYNLEPNDGILGPTTVSGLLGLLMGSYNRLKVAGAPVSKDPFDVDATKRAIAYFQKAQKLTRTRRLDRQTIEKLQRVTAKAASGEGWLVPRAVKSTMAELGGKGGEMVMGMVGARDKALISEIETLDIERLSQLVIGAKARWIWQGKPVKSGGMDLKKAGDDNEGPFSTDDQGNFMWTSRRRDTVWQANRNRAGTAGTQEQVPLSPDQRTGLNRFKDRVGISSPRAQTHQHRLSRDFVASDSEQQPPAPSRGKTGSLRLKKQTTNTSFQSDMMSDDGEKEEEPLDGHDTKQRLIPEITVEGDSQHLTVSDGEEQRAKSSLRGDITTTEGHLDRKTSLEVDMERLSRDVSFNSQEPESRYLRRSRSAIQISRIGVDDPRGYKIPRQLSFSFLEESLLTWEDVYSTETGPSVDKGPSVQLKQHESRSRRAQRISRKIMSLEQAALPWTNSHMERMDDLEEMCQNYYQELRSSYLERMDDFLGLQKTSKEVVSDEKAILMESIRKLDVLGHKLDYELDVLESRIDDVEDGVNDFQRSIDLIETRVDLLFTRPRHGMGRHRSWFPWLDAFRRNKRQGF